MTDLFDHAVNGPKRERLRGLGWRELLRPARGKNKEASRYWIDPGGKQHYEADAFNLLGQLEGGEPPASEDAGPEIHQPQGG